MYYRFHLESYEIVLIFLSLIIFLKTKNTSPWSYTPPPPGVVLVCRYDVPEYLRVLTVVHRTYIITMVELTELGDRAF
jgi:hypothetical protein